MPSSRPFQLVLPLVCISFSSLVLDVAAEEITGRITSVNVKQITIVHESNFVPNPNDKIEIFVMIPEVGEAGVGTAKVTEVRKRTRQQSFCDSLQINPPTGIAGLRQIAQDQEVAKSSQ